MLENIVSGWQGLIEMVQSGEHGYKFLLPMYIGMILTERIIHLSAHNHYNAKDAWSNVGISSANFIFGAIIGGLIQFTIYMFLFENARLFSVPFTIGGWIFVFLLHDLIYYLDHRIAHRTGLFWAFHHVHHSSKEFNLTVAARGFILDGSLTQPLYYLMPILGVSIFQFALIVMLKSLWGIFNHTRFFRNMGPLEYLLATPSNHRVHHGTDVKYLDKNYGQVLILWDILFRSFQREEEEPTYGLTKNIDTYNVAKVQVAGIGWLVERINSADRWSDKIKYLYMPPGWDHLGCHETVEVLTQRSMRKQDNFDHMASE